MCRFFFLKNNLHGKIDLSKSHPQEFEQIACRDLQKSGCVKMCQYIKKVNGLKLKLHSVTLANYGTAETVNHGQI